MRAANWRFYFVAAWAFVAIGVGANGCGGDDTHAQDSSATHFLESCSGSCDAGFECLCGVCTRPCVVADDCKALASQAVCTIAEVAHPECTNEAQLRACDVPCASDADCSSLHEAPHCAVGYCRAPVLPIDSGAGGAANGGAPSADGGSGGTASSSGGRGNAGSTGSSTGGSSAGGANGGSAGTRPADSGVGADASGSEPDASSGGTGNGPDAGKMSDAGTLLTVDPLGRWLDPGPGIGCDYSTNGSFNCNGTVEIQCSAPPINPACHQMQNYTCCFNVGCLRNWVDDANFCPGPEIMISCDPSHGTPVGCTAYGTSTTIFCCTPAP